MSQGNRLKVENIHSVFCKKIAEICKPLLLFDIKYFHFVRVYNDGSRISLSNHHAFSDYYYDQEYYLNPAISKSDSESQFDYKLWFTIKNNPVFEDLKKLFQISNGITISRHYLSFSDFYYFGSGPENLEINNFYLVEMRLLERFIAYFNDKASTIIEEAKKERIIISVQMPPSPILPKEQNKTSELLQKAFIEKTAIAKYKLTDGLEEHIFSPRQMDCIFGILENKTAKDIAKELDLSVRTVENYIQNVKLKINCHTVNQLIKKLKSILPKNMVC